MAARPSRRRRHKCLRRAWRFRTPTAGGPRCRPCRPIRRRCEQRSETCPATGQHARQVWGQDDHDFVWTHENLITSRVVAATGDPGESPASATWSGLPEPPLIQRNRTTVDARRVDARRLVPGAKRSAGDGQFGNRLRERIRCPVEHPRHRDRPAVPASGPNQLRPIDLPDYQDHQRHHRGSRITTVAVNHCSGKPMFCSPYR